MSEVPYPLPQEWRDSLQELREKVKSLPEDPEDKVLREGGIEFDSLVSELRDPVFGSGLRAVIDEAVDDSDLTP